MIALTATVPLASAHPPATTDHGVNQTTFYTLWTGDRDRVPDTASANWTAMRTLSNGTDVPLDAPPVAVERWNRGELADFPATGPDRSIHPSGATLEDGRFVRDAYVGIVAVQPSTRAFLDPSATPRYVGSNGTVLGTVDYRVGLPEDDTSGSRRVTWRLVEHRIVETRLEVDGAVERRAVGSHTPELAFEDLEDYPGEVHTLEIAAEIEVTLQRTVRVRDRVCETHGNTTTCRTVWRRTVTHPVETLTVSDTVEVTEYDLSVIGFATRYPDGDLELAVYKDHPWLGYTYPDGKVRGVWRFFAIRDESWDTLQTSTAAGTTSAHSPIHPLQVAAYPFEPGPTVSPRETVTLVAVYGSTTEPPSLPPDVNLDVVEGPYVASFGIVTRIETGGGDSPDLRAHGLVRGVAVDHEDVSFTEVPMNRSRITATVIDRSEQTVTVRVHLVDAETGEPIDTGRRPGYVLVGGDRVETGPDGTVERRLPRPPGDVPVRYVTGAWWWYDVGYVGDSTIAPVRGPVLGTISMLYRAAVPVGLFLLAVFLIDRVTGLAIWPPWRGL